VGETVTLNDNDMVLDGIRPISTESQLPFHLGFLQVLPTKRLNVYKIYRICQLTGTAHPWKSYDGVTGFLWDAPCLLCQLDWQVLALHVPIALWLPQSRPVLPTISKGRRAPGIYCYICFKVTYVNVSLWLYLRQWRLAYYKFIITQKFCKHNPYRVEI